MNSIMIKIVNNETNINFFKLLRMVDIENSNETGSPRRLLSYNVSDSDISFHINSILKLYDFISPQFLEVLNLTNDENSCIINWVEEICISYLSSYEISESILLEHFASLLMDCRKIGIDINYYNTARCKYNAVADVITWFIIKKIGGSILNISEAQFLAVWNQIKLKK